MFQENFHVSLVHRKIVDIFFKGAFGVFLMYWHFLPILVILVLLIMLKIVNKAVADIVLWMPHCDI